jgi:hypothetical protein
LLSLHAEAQTQTPACPNGVDPFTLKCRTAPPPVAVLLLTTTPAPARVYRLSHLPPKQPGSSTDDPWGVCGVTFSEDAARYLGATTDGPLWVPALPMGANVLCFQSLDSDRNIQGVGLLRIDILAAGQFPRNITLSMAPIVRLRPSRSGCEAPDTVSVTTLREADNSKTSWGNRTTLVLRPGSTYEIWLSATGYDTIPSPIRWGPGMMGQVLEYCMARRVGVTLNVKESLNSHVILTSPGAQAHPSPSRRAMAQGQLPTTPEGIELSFRDPSTTVPPGDYGVVACLPGSTDDGCVLDETAVIVVEGESARRVIVNQLTIQPGHDLTLRVVHLPPDRPQADEKPDEAVEEAACHEYRGVSGGDACANAAVLLRSRVPADYPKARSLLQEGCRKRSARACVASFAPDIDLAVLCNGWDPYAWLACLRQTNPGTRYFTWVPGPEGWTRGSEDETKRVWVGGRVATLNVPNNGVPLPKNPSLFEVSVRAEFPAWTGAPGAIGAVAHGGLIGALNPIQDANGISGSRFAFGYQGELAGDYATPHLGPLFLSLEAGGLFIVYFNDSASAVGLKGAVTLHFGRFELSAVAAWERVPELTRSPSGAPTTPIDGTMKWFDGLAASYVVPISN